MINYSTGKRNNLNKLDRNKRNVLLIGKGTKNEKAKIILNPIDVTNAKNIYGNSQLYEAYKFAREITNDNNVYTVNCPLFTDFIEIIDSLVHYDFDFIVPLNIYLQDTFINPITDEVTYFTSYYLERLGITENHTTMIMTDRPSYLYDDIDLYIEATENTITNFKNKNAEIVNKYGNNLVFVLNNLRNNVYSNVMLAASLAACDFTEYPKNINISTYFDIDYSDLNLRDICFYKYHEASAFSSMEQLLNFRVADDIYKKVLIDILIKYVIRHLDLSLSEFRGVLYTPYVKVQIDMRVERVMNSLKKFAYKDYIIKSIVFRKTGIGIGNVLIDVSITPYSVLETINIVLEV